MKENKISAFFAIVVTGICLGYIRDLYSLPARIAIAAALSAALYFVFLFAVRFFRSDRAPKA